MASVPFLQRAATQSRGELRVTVAVPSDEESGRLFGVPTYRWIPARATVSVEYWVIARPASAIPGTLEWPG